MLKLSTFPVILLLMSIALVFMARVGCNEQPAIIFTGDTDDATSIEKSPIVVTCVGDSITSYGCASSINMTYVAQLGRILGRERYTVVNYGTSGTTMLKDGYCANLHKNCSGNCSYWRSHTFPGAIQSQPDIVTIMLGTNDAKWCNWYGPPNGNPSGLGVNYREAYVEMVALFRSLATQPKVFLVIPPPLVNPPLHPENPSPFNMSQHVINDMLPAMIRSIAAETGADGVIDVWSAIGGIAGFEDSEMTCDGCHPKDKAMTIIAETIAKQIQTIIATME